MNIPEIDEAESLPGPARERLEVLAPGGGGIVFPVGVVGGEVEGEILRNPRQEIRDGLREAGTLTLTPAELDQVMAAYDLNHDQRISHHEAQLGADRGPKIFDKNP